MVKENITSDLNCTSKKIMNELNSISAAEISKFLLPKRNLSDF